VRAGFVAAAKWVLAPPAPGQCAFVVVPLRPRSRAQTIRLQKDRVARKLVWPTYLGITAPLLLFVVALAGGIIWYNSLKTTELMVAAAERQMIETAEKISERIGLLYAIVAFASQVPEMKAPLQAGRDQGFPFWSCAYCR
jgi:hypothetical protein